MTTSITIIIMIMMMRIRIKMRKRVKKDNKRMRMSMGVKRNKSIMTKKMREGRGAIQIKREMNLLTRQK